jgi:protease-4
MGHSPAGLHSRWRGSFEQSGVAGGSPAFEWIPVSGVPSGGSPPRIRRARPLSPLIHDVMGALSGVAGTCFPSCRSNQAAQTKINRTMKDQPSLPGRFFRSLWSAVVFLYRAIGIIATLLVLVGIWMVLSGGPPVHVENNIALVINPSGDLVEQDDDAGRALVQQLRNGRPAETAMGDIIDALDAAAKDPRITAAVLELDDLGAASLAQVEEINAAVKRFRAAGKPVHAYGASYNQAQYLLATSATDIALDPMGELMLTGLGVYPLYFKDALDKLGVTVNVFRVGQFKSAVEPFERNDMSPAARMANAAWLGDLWQDYNNQVALARKLKAAPVDGYIAGFASGLEQLSGNAAAYAKTLGFVDRIETLPEFRKRVANKVGLDKDTGSFRQIGFQDYLRAVPSPDASRSGSEIAVVTVEGDIVDGIGMRGEAGGDSISALIDSVRRDDNVAALVLRVNSPGGSVNASEKIRRAIQGVQDDGTPVVVSMSGVAASGGYWISMDADEIWAHASTITGSIGIFGMWPTFDQPLNKLGIHSDGIGTTPLAAALHMDRPMTDDMKRIMQSTVEFGYRQFISGVAKGRDLPADKVEQIAQGRVWSGAAAKKLGLVDDLGGLHEAIASAAELAGLKPGAYRVTMLKPQRSFWQEVMDDVAGDSHAALGWTGMLKNLQWQPANRALAVTRQLSHFNDPRGEYAYCFCQVRLQ